MAEIDWEGTPSMSKAFPIILVVLLFLMAGCTLSLAPPSNMAEAIGSPTALATTSMTAMAEPSSTPTPGGSPTHTPVLLKHENTATPTVVGTEEATAAESKKKPALFFFYADWCSACSLMRPVIEKLKVDYSERIRFFMVNVDDPESRELVVMVGVRAIPLTIFVSSPDQQAQRWVGPRPESVLRAALDEALNDQ